MAALTGITLTSIGCRDGGGGLCRSGLTTGGIGLGAVGGGVWLLVDALPEVQVRPIFEPQLALQLSPTGIRGRF